MPTKRKSVRQLAQEAQLDIDETLVTLWDAGFEDVLNPTDLIGPRDLNRARRALGLATRRDLRDSTYWRQLLGITEGDLWTLLDDLSVLTPAIRRRGSLPARLPRKAVSRLRSEARRRALDPVTGASIPADRRVGPVRPPNPPWEPPGHERDLRWLAEDEVLNIHHALAADFAETQDPIDPPGCRSEHLLASAVFRPQTSLGDHLKYPTVESSAAALLHALIQDHPFHNGNKRTGLVAMLVFLDENGFVVTCHEDQLFKLVLQIAQHSIAALGSSADAEVLAIAEWICRNTRLVEKGEHPIPWRKLRRLLTSFGCVVEHAPGVGNRVNISRTIEVRRLFKSRSKTLSTQVAYGDEGRDVGKSTIKKIREDLRLDDAHGIDSAAFYGRVSTQPTDFILKYSKTLKRLARL